MDLEQMTLRDMLISTDARIRANGENLLRAALESRPANMVAASATEADAIARRILASSTQADGLDGLDPALRERVLALRPFQRHKIA